MTPTIGVAGTNSKGGEASLPQVAVVLGAYGSGTSAVAALVAALGANAHPPFADVADPRTPISGESVTLRQIILPEFDHQTLKRRGTPAYLVPKLRIWAGPGLSVAKLPALAFFLPEVQRAWDVRAILILRDHAEIEATRLRRGWPEEYGRVGAESIDSAIANGLAPGTPKMSVTFSDVLADPIAIGADLAAFLGRKPDPCAVRRAVRPPAVSLPVRHS